MKRGQEDQSLPVHAPLRHSGVPSAHAAAAVLLPHPAACASQVPLLQLQVILMSLAGSLSQGMLQL